MRHTDDQHTTGIAAFEAYLRDALSRTANTDGDQDERPSVTVHEVTFEELAQFMSDGSKSGVNVAGVVWPEIEAIVKSNSHKLPNERLVDRLTRERDDMATAVAVLVNKIARRDEQITRLMRYPENDPCADGAILRFVKKFPKSEQSYAYVATRIDGLWYLTGKRSPQGITWSGLVEFMGLGVDEVWHVNYQYDDDGTTKQCEMLID